eukprot:CAMPEP_0206538528 /NCGR_PEP_ID=MMETSP0325_2-20121206/7911_1 /ASSEMBLY_ACC=CAM_ASM_000347 /TAXON_ID=2866 /ORGANISM="Crypthecodinium cohnii, Strain Seligo" /LENGTH=343 /DNA_ID=CAMNT_0054035973 /DNA_START=67 /DNA_END=1098 /DNA_ORIENTATION=+
MASFTEHPSLPSCQGQTQVQMPYRIHNTFIDFLSQQPSEETCELIQSSKQRSRSEGVASRDRSDSRFTIESEHEGSNAGLRYLPVLTQTATLSTPRRNDEVSSVQSHSHSNTHSRFRSDSSDQELERSNSMSADLSEPCMSPALSGMSSQGRTRWADLEEVGDEDDDNVGYWSEQPKMRALTEWTDRARTGVECEPLACHSQSDNNHRFSNSEYNMMGAWANTNVDDDFQQCDEDACTVMIKNLWCKCSGTMLADIIDRAGMRGQHRHVYVPMRQSSVRAATNRGFGFVTFNSPAEVKHCFEKLDGKIVRFGSVTREIHVALAHRQGDGSGRKSPCPIAWGRV